MGSKCQEVEQLKKHGWECLGVENGIGLKFGRVPYRKMPVRLRFEVSAGMAEADGGKLVF